jgi:hypothetical protein
MANHVIISLRPRALMVSGGADISVTLFPAEFRQRSRKQTGLASDP